MFFLEKFNLMRLKSHAVFYSHFYFLTPIFMEKTTGALLRKTAAASAVFLLLSNYVLAQSAPVAGQVVISEVAWAGTAASANDEWIELYNTTGSAIDLSGWMIDDDDGSQQYVIASGTIAAHSYFLIEDVREATSASAGVIVNLSLSNTGDKLVLKNAAGETIDIVNSTGGTWFAGSSDPKKSMEKIDLSQSGDAAANWASAAAEGSAVDRAGAPVIGTPAAANSVSAVRAEVSLAPSNLQPAAGETVTVAVNVQNAQNLFSYGMDIIYDPSVLEFVSAAPGGFLSESGGAETSFQYGLENGIAGKLVVAEARIGAARTGVSGRGSLFAVVFRAAGAEGRSSSVSVGSGSFLSDAAGDIAARFSGTDISVRITIVPPAQNLSGREGADRYAIALNWEPSAETVDFYKIFRKKPDGAFLEIGTTTLMSFEDSRNIVPNVVYEYKVSAVRAGRESVALQTTQMDARGIKGDNNRSDRVDGRDLERLARHFAQTQASEGFDPLIDTTYDGRIDGSDLIDIGASWALLYE